MVAGLSCRTGGARAEGFSRTGFVGGGAAGTSTVTGDCTTAGAGGGGICLLAATTVAGFGAVSGLTATYTIPAASIAPVKKAPRSLGFITTPYDLNVTGPFYVT